MKHFLIILLTLLIAAGSSVEAKKKKSGKTPADSPTAILMKVVKEVQIKRSGKTDWTDAKVGMPLYTSDEIKTGAGSLALVKFTDNSVLRVRESSVLKIYVDKNNKSISKNTYIERGTVGFEVTKQEKDEFKFTTPTMVASIRGTEGVFQVSSDSTLLNLFKGLVVAWNTANPNNTINVTPGTFASAGSNGTLNSGQQNQQQQQQQQQQMKRTKLKKLVIDTNMGKLVIEYYVEE